MSPLTPAKGSSASTSSLTRHSLASSPARQSWTVCFSSRDFARATRIAHCACSATLAPPLCVLAEMTFGR